ncbi:MAG: TIGR00282 family metallophosphoesterase [Candidatus Eisenbacteria bacterium]|uniref:TIGR00282 family metallophosphoesterase n=1 Tax=Eiseniibacteriota bacterium TaxID=2212470 RepID=A0A956RQI5_UNCEI|nr:TIGR00282 family metallophosphoesterase [Candidatus Eisenbacteria bacterium]
MRILMIGDVVAAPGRRILTHWVPRLRRELQLDLVVANVENAAGGVGITSSTVAEIRDSGVDVLTGGNHIWDKSEGIGVIEESPALVRPLNYPPGTPGRGFGIYSVDGQRVAVLNALGRIFMNPIDCPFRTIDAVLGKLDPAIKVILVDFHAEATAEKIAMGWYLDGRVSAVVGTHTHVQTADERILPQGTGYLTDVGMTGPHDSVIGVRKELALRRMTSGLPVRFQPAEHDARLHGVWMEFEPTTGRTVHMERIQRRMDPD